MPWLSHRGHKEPSGWQSKARQTGSGLLVIVAGVGFSPVSLTVEKVLSLDTFTGEACAVCSRL